MTVGSPRRKPISASSAALASSTANVEGADIAERIGTPPIQALASDSE